MTIVDINVISEATRPSPSEMVTRWMRDCPRGELFTTSVTESEIFLGIELMSAGKRRESLHAAVEKILNRIFVGRILPFDSQAARFYAQIVASRRRAGRPISQSDAQIAAIATRNVDDFRDCGITVINPWES